MLVELQRLRREKKEGFQAPDVELPDARAHIVGLSACRKNPLGIALQSLDHSTLLALLAPSFALMAMMMKIPCMEDCLLASNNRLGL